MTKTMNIKGMMCPHCQARVSKVLNAIEGVTAVVDHTKGTAVLELSQPVEESVLAAAVTDAGYEVVGFC